MENSMLRMLCIVPTPYIGGLQIMTLRLFENLSDSISCHFFVTRWTDGEFTRRLDALQIPYTASWMGMFSRHLDIVNLKMTLHCISKLPALYRDFIRLIHQYQPDIIYVASYHELILLFPLLIKNNIPIIYHVHGLLPTTQFYKVSFSVWGKVVDHYLSVSGGVQRSIEALDVPANKISLLYNGIDLSDFPYIPTRSDKLAAKFGWPSNVTIIGMTGQMLAGKGHLDFLKTGAILRREFPNVRFVIGGKQEGAYYIQLKQQVAELALDDIVGFSGWQDDMSNFYASLDIFVFPGYLTGEGFGLVIAEAMATGIPAVVARSGGATEVIEDQISGLLTEPQNPLALANAIRHLLLAPQFRKKLVKAALARVESLFNLSCQASKFEQIVSQMVNTHVAY